MAKKHSDKGLQNMSVEELQSLKNDLLPQKKRPNYDTRTFGGRDDPTGMCCDGAYGCCDGYCTECDGICPDDWIDPEDCDVCPTIEYPDIYIRGISESYQMMFISYPFGDDFKNVDFINDVLVNSIYDLDGNSVFPELFDQINIYYSSDGYDFHYITLVYDWTGAWSITADDVGDFTENKILPVGTGLNIKFKYPRIIKWTL